MNIIIPMAGRSQRFKDAGYKVAKPFLDVCGKTMLQRAIENLNVDGTYIFIVRPEHEEKTWCVINEFMYPNKCIVSTGNASDPGVVAACLRVQPYLRLNQPLIVANCDQIIDWYPQDFLEYCQKCDGCVATFKADSPQHSYIVTDKAGKALCLKEKNVVSDDALCGVHWWRNAKMAMWSFEQSLKGLPHYNNDYYIAPTYNQLINIGAVIKQYKTRGMTILGTPEQYEAYINERGS